MDNSNSHLANASQDDGAIDLKTMIYKFLNQWPLFLVGIIIALFIAFLVNRYSDRIYEVKTVLLIEDESNSGMGIEQAMTSLGFYNPRLTFENEVVIIESYSIAERTLANLDFNISFISEGRFKSSELYNESLPIILVIDSTHTQILNSDFRISYDKESDKLKLTAPEEISRRVLVLLK